jgi:hypothetical protein
VGQGWRGHKSEYEKIDIAGLILSGIGLLTAIIHPFLVQWLAVSGFFSGS